MSTTGKIEKSIFGHEYEIHGYCNAGGQATIHDAVRLKDGQVGKAKFFHSHLDRKQILSRTRFLFEQRLDLDCWAICGPDDVFDNERGFGHFCRLAPGVPVADFLEAAKAPRLVDQIQAACAVARAFEVLEKRGIAHGDIQSGNVLLHRRGDVIEGSIIDLDNFVAPGQAPPPCIGHELYLAPEIRLTLTRSEIHAPTSPTSPTLLTDRFSQAVLYQEILLGRHPASGRDGSDGEFNAAMASGRWLDDPDRRRFRDDADQGGFPASVLNPGLLQLFRRAFSLHPDLRPSAAEWVGQLQQALFEVALCPRCGRPFVLHCGQFFCPWDNEEFPVLMLCVRGSRIPLDQEAMVLTRSLLAAPGDPGAVIHRIGPETRLTCRGRSTCRFNGTRWVNLPPELPLLLKAGDRLLLGGVEALVQAA